jgi:Domain of unknown function (DUF5658)
MAYGRALVANEAIPNWVRFGAVANGNGTELRRRSAARVYWSFLVIFASLQVADVITTNYALGTPGNWEANPIMQLSQAQFGVAWWIPKAGAVGFAAIVIPRLKPRWPMVFAVSYYVVLIIGNLVCL